jgi:alkylated DNA repair dioxygenase AlkB
MEKLPFREFEFHGFTGKRRIVSFGWRYDFNGGGLTRTEDMPSFLSGFRARAEAFAGIAAGGLQQVLITEYAPGAAIGWHKDRSVFGDVVRHFASFSLHLPPAPQNGPALGAAKSHSGAAVGLPAARSRAYRVGAQYSRC